MRYFFYIFFIFFSFLSLSAHNVSDVFSNIYDKGIWGKNEDGRGNSGSGSTLESAKPYLDYVNQFIKEKNVKSIIEIGCGDGVLLKYLQLGDEVSYTGYDVVDSILDRNRQEFPRFKFENRNIEIDGLPEADLILCKDVLQHLPNNMVLNMVKIIKNQCKWAIITNDLNLKEKTRNNKDIKIGLCRPLDLNDAPFNFEFDSVLRFNENKTKKLYIVKNVLLYKNTN